MVCLIFAFLSPTTEPETSTAFLRDRTRLFSDSSTMVSIDGSGSVVMSRQCKEQAPETLERRSFVFNIVPRCRKRETEVLPHSAHLRKLTVDVDTPKEQRTQSTPFDLLFLANVLLIYAVPVCKLYVSYRALSVLAATRCLPKRILATRRKSFHRSTHWRGVKAMIHKVRCPAQDLGES